MFTDTSNSHAKLVAAVVEDIKTSDKVESMTLPAILPRPKFSLCFKFQNWLKEKVLRCIEWNSKITLKATRPRSFVNPRTPCILIRACESWREWSYCLTRIHCSVGNYLCLLKIKDLNSGADDYRCNIIFWSEVNCLLPLKAISRAKSPLRNKINLRFAVIKFELWLKNQLCV